MDTFVLSKLSQKNHDKIQSFTIKYLEAIFQH